MSGGLVESILGAVGGAGLSFGNQLANSALGHYYNKKTMAKQYAYRLLEAKNMPSAQVEGLRNANLNPLLAVGGSFGGSPSALSGGYHTSDSDWLSSAQKGAMMGSTVGSAVEEKKKKEKENKILDEKIQQEESLTSAIQSESLTRQYQAELNEVEAVAQMSALTGRTPVVEVNNERSIYRSKSFKDYVTKLKNQIEYDSYKRNRAHAIWEDTINAVHGINEGASAYENVQSARKHYHKRRH